MTISREMQSLIDAPLANALKPHTPGGRRPAPRSPKADFADDIGPKLSSKEVRERRAKAAAEKLAAVLDYYATTDLSDEKIAEHAGLYKQVETGRDDLDRPIYSRVPDVDSARKEMAWRRAR